MKILKTIAISTMTIALMLTIAEPIFATKVPQVNYAQLSSKERQKVKFSGAWHYDAKNSPSVYVRVYRNMKIKNGTKKQIKFTFSKIRYYRRHYPKRMAPVALPHRAVVINPGKSVTVRRAFDVYGQQCLYDSTLNQFYYYQRPSVKVLTNADLQR
ncbi:hypothetical protein [Lentilactobacillus kosonis]|uniref:Uncharacterized protein n=1 Tax=Lentilactobacillus kosonis TaxID=2810561 RepID=A0A401FNK0_9LACO|nr:hypothetical protein [Lentilactobacillus kosonis]GAY73886.1 hypothetical protein NBRC111893_2032 [Lentilactobacillus kosonis]